MKTCVKPSEPNRNFGTNPTTITQPMREEEVLFNIDRENFPLSVIEAMLFKLEDNREIAAQKLLKILSDSHSIKQMHQNLGYLISNLQEWKQQTLQFHIHPF